MAQRVPKLFVPLDVDLDHDPYIAAGGPWAELLWTRCLRWAKKRPAERGFIPASALADIGKGVRQPAHKLDQLLATPMHEACTEPPLLRLENGWKIRSWDAWNQTVDEIEHARHRKQIGALIANHKQGRHKDGPVGDCPICTRRGRYSERSATRSTVRPSERPSDAEKESSYYVTTSTRTDDPEGGRRPGANQHHWHDGNNEPAAYQYNPQHPEEGGWDGGTWIKPAIWRPGWKPDTTTR